MIGSESQEEGVNSGEIRETLRRSYDYIKIAGEATLAARFSNRKAVDCIEIFGCDYSIQKPGIEIVHFDNYKRLKSELKTNEYKRLESWIKRFGCVDKPIKFNLTGDSNEIRGAIPYRDDWGMSYDLGGKKEYVNLCGLKEWAGLKVELIRPAETVRDVLDCLELGRKLDIPVDTDILAKADNETRSGRLILRDRPQQRLHNNPPTMVTNLDNDVVRRILDEYGTDSRVVYKNLVGLCKKIAEQGGMSQYLLNNYGKAYLEQEGIDNQFSTGSSHFRLGYVRLYYPNMNRAVGTLVVQREALARLYEIDELPRFKFLSIEKTGPEKNLPESKTVERFVDKKRLRDALANRTTGGFDRLIGSYEVSYLSPRLEQEDLARDKVKNLLEVLGDDKERILSGPGKLSKRLATVLDNRNPIFSVFDYAENNNVQMIVTKDPLTILRASTDTPWISCVSLPGGIHKNGLYEDIKNGTAIAFVIKDGKPVGRSLIRKARTEKGLMVGVIEKYYGDNRYSSVAQEAIARAIRKAGLEVGERCITDGVFKDLWADSGTRGRVDGRIYYGYSLDEIEEIQRKAGVIFKLTSVLRQFIGTKRSGLQTPA